LQRDVEEQTEQAESTQRELDQLRSKLRSGGDKPRFVCQTVAHHCHFYQFTQGHGVVPRP